MVNTLAELTSASVAELEVLYQSDRVVAVPGAVFRGHFLCWLDTAGAHNPVYRATEALFFEHMAFGVDFAQRRWFWFSPTLAVGHFSATVGPSRWRDTATLRLTYDDRFIPWAIRSRLYDEVKPLSDALCLGIGGIDGPRGLGDHFFFALTPA